MKIFLETKQKFLRPSTFERLIRKGLGKCRRSKIVLGIIDDNLAMAYQTPDGSGVLIAFIAMENIYVTGSIDFPEPVKTPQCLKLNRSTGGRKVRVIIRPDKKRLFVVSEISGDSAELDIRYHPSKCPRTWKVIERTIVEQEKHLAEYYKNGVPET